MAAVPGGVVAFAADQDVGTEAAVQHVVAAAALQDAGSVVGVQLVVVEPADQALDRSLDVVALLRTVVGHAVDGDAHRRCGIGEVRDVAAVAAVIGVAVDTAEQIVVARAALHRVEARAALDDVVVLVAAERVRAAVTLDDVDAGTAEQEVAVGAVVALEDVVAVAADDVLDVTHDLLALVVPRVEVEVRPVVCRAVDRRGDRVVRSPELVGHRVVAGAALEDVGPEPAVQQVVPSATCQDVLALWLDPGSLSVERVDVIAGRGRRRGAIR